MSVGFTVSMQVLRVATLLLFLVNLAPALRHSGAESRRQVDELRHNFQLLQRFERQLLIHQQFLCEVNTKHCRKDCAVC